ncbi:hypothetical protein [Agrobacterium rosae]|uniref:hypothetical protein n=1 Tax=Agrobacterium rosae TaxID=1972867 RepID=UPI002033A385|nr:hypothetical protein [Agrobacterium rosae]MCM2431947.1 right-handed parallel beta-helix repeat-containing protein [Agrobacterium rosae]
MNAIVPPVMTTNIAYQTPVSDEIIVNRDGSTGVQTTGDLAVQLAATSPLDLGGFQAPLFATEAALKAAALASKVSAWVFDDPDADKNGVWSWIGTEWVWTLPLPYSLSVLENLGAGTSNAIVASSKVPLVEGLMVVLPIVATTTASPVTLKVNNNKTFTIKTLTGNDVVPGGLVEDMLLLALVKGETLRLVTDQASAAIQAAAEVAAERAQDAADRAEDAASAVINLASLGGDPTGGTDASSILVAAFSIYKHIIVPMGVFKLATDFSVPTDVKIEFLQGGRFDIATGTKITWNGSIVAGPYQRIFSGNLVQSAYVTNSLTPYVFALRGNPKISWSSPFWFGAKGDNVTDDYNACLSACFFGPSAYFPALDVDAGNRYLCTTSIPIRRSGTKLFGDGYKSWIRLVSYIPTGVGGLVAIAGLLPTSSGGLPAASVDDILIDGLHIDTNNGINDNGIGGSFARNIEVKNCHFSNVGRKAVTWQYHVHNWNVHDCIIHSASKETGGNQNAMTGEGENSTFTYANGVPGFDWNGDDNTGHKIERIHIEESGNGAITLSNSKRVTVKNMTVNSLGPTGRPIVTSRVTKDVTFENIKVKKSTLGFIRAGSANSISQKFKDCWIEDCSGDNMFYSEGPGSEFIRSGGTQTDDRIAWSIRGVDCKIENSKAICSAITSGTQATSLFSTAARFQMKGCFIDCATALRGFGGSTAADIEIADTTFTGGITDGVLVAGVNAHVHDNTIGGNASGRVRVSTGAAGVTVHDNRLTGGASASIDWATVANLWASGAKYNNIGDVSLYHCLRFGGRIDGAVSGSPESIIDAAMGSTMRNVADGNVYRKTTALGTLTGWVAM